MSFGFSVGDFLSAAGLIKDIVACLKDSGGSASEYQELMLELDGLRLALHKIETLQVSDDRMFATEAIKVAALNCQYVLREFLTKLRKYDVLENGNNSNGWIKTSAKKIQWELVMKTEVQQLRAYLAAHTHSLNLRLVTEGLQTVSVTANKAEQRHHEIHQKLDHTATTMISMNHNLLNLTRHFDDATTSKLLDRLSNSNIYHRHQDICSQRQDHTGEWLLDELAFKDWLDGTGHSTIWCSGDPGTGKTIIASMVIQHVHQSYGGSNTGAAFLYLDYKDQSQQTVMELTGSLIKQLAEQREDLVIQVSSYFASNKIPTLQGYQSLLLAFCAAFSQCYVLVDALDECSLEVRASFMPILSALEQASVRLFVTSRPNLEDIKMQFARVPNVIIQAKDQDVRRYLAERIAVNSVFRKRVSTSQCGQIVDTIASRTSGMFLMAVLQLERIWVERTATKIMKALHCFPSKLDDAYENILARITEQPEPDRALAFRILAWISCSKRPLLAAELIQALAVEWDDDKQLPEELDFDNILDQESLVDVCAGLVVIDVESKVVRLVHFTTEEYFRKMTGSLFPNAHNEISRTCLVYLSFGIFSAQQYWWNEELSIRHYRRSLELTYDLYSSTKGSYNPEDVESRLRRFPFFRYAAKHWSHHFKQRRADDCDQDTMNLVVKVLNAKPGLLMLPHAVVPSRVIGDRSHLKDEHQRYACEGTTSLHVCAALGLSSIMAKLLECDEPAINRLHGRCGMTSLHFAVVSGDEDTTNMLLLQESINIEAADGMGRTALHYAADLGLPEVTRLLLKHGAAIEPRSSSLDLTRTPLVLAATAGGSLVLAILLQYGANPDMGCKADHTALHEAASYGHVDAVKVLLQGGADCNVKALSTDTPLHYATYFGHMEIVQMLLDSGAECDVQDRNGETPMMIAEAHGHEKVVELLRTAKEATKKVEITEDDAEPHAISEIGHDHNDSLRL